MDGTVDSCALIFNSSVSAGIVFNLQLRLVMEVGNKGTLDSWKLAGAEWGINNVTRYEYPWNLVNSTLKSRRLRRYGGFESISGVKIWSDQKG